MILYSWYVSSRVSTITSCMVSEIIGEYAIWKRRTAQITESRGLEPGPGNPITS